MYDNTHQQAKRYAEIATQAIMSSLGYKMGDEPIQRALDLQGDALFAEIIRGVAAGMKLRYLGIHEAYGVLLAADGRGPFAPSLGWLNKRLLPETMDEFDAPALAGKLYSSAFPLVHYIVQAGETADAEAFVRELAQRVPQHGDALMTIAHQLEQKGIEKGLQQGLQLGEQRGIEKGRNEGKQEGKFEVARTMLQNGIDRNTV
ncbi:hypothetical protein ACRZZT_004825, partial [Salmonella enterica subsp. enterica serovar Infantis]